MGASPVRAGFNDVEKFGKTITRVYRPVFEESAERRALVAPVRYRGSSNFNADLCAQTHGDFVLSNVKATGHEVEYQGKVERDESALKIYYISSGTAVIRQDGREQTLEAGQLGVHDSMRPYQVWTETGFDSLIMALPRTRLTSLGTGYGDLSAIRFTNEGIGSVVLPYLQGLSDGLPQLLGPQGAPIARSTIDLLTTLFASEVGKAEPTPEQERAQQRERIERWIEDHLDDDVSPKAIAAAHFMSVRSLHALFAEANTTVGTVVRNLRFVRAKDFLLLQPQMPVAEVGRRAGFADPSHFTRVFRTVSGMTPTEFRADSLHSESSDPALAS